MKFPKVELQWKRVHILPSKIDRKRWSFPYLILDKKCSEIWDNSPRIPHEHSKMRLKPVWSRINGSLSPKVQWVKLLPIQVHIFLSHQEYLLQSLYHIIISRWTWRQVQFIHIALPLVNAPRRHLYIVGSPEWVRYEQINMWEYRFGNLSTQSTSSLSSGYWKWGNKCTTLFCKVFKSRNPVKWLINGPTFQKNMLEVCWLPKSQRWSTFFAEQPDNNLSTLGVIVHVVVHVLFTRFKLKFLYI